MPIFQKRNPNKPHVLTTGPLPKDGANVAWKTIENPNGDWKLGTFSETENAFFVGFSTTSSDWDYVNSVYMWKYL